MKNDDPYVYPVGCSLNISQGMSFSGATGLTIFVPASVHAPGDLWIVI